MLVYCDTSMLLRLIAEEPGSRLAAALWDGADAVVTARLSDLEVRATLLAAGRAGALAPAGTEASIATWDRLSLGLRWLEFTADVAHLGARLTARHPIRSSDAVQLASALTLGSPATLMAVFDRRLSAAASAEGLQVAPRFG